MKDVLLGVNNLLLEPLLVPNLIDTKLYMIMEDPDRAVATIRAWGSRAPHKSVGLPPMILVTVQFNSYS